MNNTISKRKEKLDEKNQIVNIDNTLWDEILTSKYGQTFDTSQASKRISINKNKER